MDKIDCSAVKFCGKRLGDCYFDNDIEKFDHSTSDNFEILTMVKIVGKIH